MKGLERTVENNLLPTLQAEAYTRAQEMNLAAQGFKPSSLGPLLGQFGLAPGSFKTIVKVNTTAAQLNVNQQLFNVPAYYLYRAAKSAVSGSTFTTLNARGDVALVRGHGLPAGDRGCGADRKRALPGKGGRGRAGAGARSPGDGRGHTSGHACGRRFSCRASSRRW